MSLKISKIDERLANRCIKGLLWGPYKIGKTSQLWTLDPETTLWIDLEAGGLSVEHWPGDSIELRDWPTAQDLACYLVGPDPNRRSDQPYSQAHYDYCVQAFGAPEFGKYRTWFIDSITVASRIAFAWAQGQPRAFSEKTGKPDIRGAYGLLAEELIAWVTHLQHARGVNVWFVGLLDLKKDDFGRAYWEPQIEGQKAGLAIPGIVDQVISMVDIPDANGNPVRSFVCRQNNQWNLPAGDRSGRLDLIEPPNLAQIMAKIQQPLQSRSLTYDLSANAETAGKDEN